MLHPENHLLSPLTLSSALKNIIKQTLELELMLFGQPVAEKEVRK